MDHAKVACWLAEWARTWSLPALAGRAHFETSRRLRTSLGRCHPPTGRIRLHPALLDEPEGLLREVACHEAAHVAVYMRHGSRVRPHGPEWAELMVAAGFEPRARMNPALLSQAFRCAMRPRVLYQHDCPVCGAGRAARRPVRRWRCRACRESGLEGKLAITTRPNLDAPGG